MDHIELQAEAAKAGYTLVEQTYLYNLSCAARAAKNHVDAVRDIMAAGAVGTSNDEMNTLRQKELKLFVRLVEACENVPWTDGEL